MIILASMADPDVIHSSEESEESDTSHAIVDCAPAAEQCKYNNIVVKHWIYIVVAHLVVK